MRDLGLDKHAGIPSLDGYGPASEGRRPRQGKQS